MEAKGWVEKKTPEKIQQKIFRLEQEIEALKAELAMFDQKAGA